MTLVKRNSDSFLPSFFDNFLSRDWMDWTNSNFSNTNTNTTLPAVNVQDTENEFVIEVAAPGLNKDDFKISLNHSQLTISSEKKEEKQSKEGNYSRKEFSYQSFQRSFQLPENLVEGDKITANYKEGILYIHVPKRDEVKPKPSRTIEIS